MNSQKIHESVMVGEIVENLHINKLGKTDYVGSYIDCTTGTAGHSIEIAKRGGNVLSIEADPEMYEIAKSRTKNYKNITLINDNFINIDKIARQNGFTNVDGILLDLGVTNLHLLDGDRGFSFSNSNPDTPLDMRLNQKSQGVKASDLLNLLRQDQLEKLFDLTLERSSSRWLSSQVIDRRNEKKFEKVSDFLDITENLRSDKMHISKATLPFLALRIAVNSELFNLEEVLPKAYELLKTGGRLLVITFHSGEDNIVKKFKKDSEVILPSDLEIANNNKARSAKLRVITKK